MGTFSDLFHDDLNEQLDTGKKIDTGMMFSKMQEFLDTNSDIFSDELLERMPRMLEERRDIETGFCGRLYSRWASLIDLFETFIVMSREIGENYNKEFRNEAVTTNDYKFESIVTLHARGCLVSESILSLLKNGFPDMALSSWRTLHEIVAVSCCIAENDQDIAERFLLYGEVEKLKFIKNNIKHKELLNIPVHNTPSVAEQEAVVGRLKERFGKIYLSEHGWIKSILPKAKFIDIEKMARLDMFRGYYKIACSLLHVGPQRDFAPLGTSECKEPILLVGRSNSSIAVPVSLVILSLTVLVLQFLKTRRNVDLAVEIMALRKFREKIIQNIIERKDSSLSSDSADSK